MGLRKKEVRDAKWSPEKAGTDELDDTQASSNNAGATRPIWLRSSAAGATSGSREQPTRPQALRGPLPKKRRTDNIESTPLSRRPVTPPPALPSLAGFRLRPQATSPVDDSSIDLLSRSTPDPFAVYTRYRFGPVQQPPQFSNSGGPAQRSASQYIESFADMQFLNKSTMPRPATTAKGQGPPAAFRASATMKRAPPHVNAQEQHGAVPATGGGAPQLPNSRPMMPNGSAQNAAGLGESMSYSPGRLNPAKKAAAASSSFSSSSSSSSFSSSSNKPQCVIGDPANAANTSGEYVKDQPIAAGQHNRELAPGYVRVEHQANGANGRALPQKITDAAGNTFAAPDGVNLSDDTSTWPKTPFCALENYINRQGVWDETDRLYMMGIQAGMGYGIVAYKNALVTEFQHTGKLWGQDVVFTDGTQDRGQRAEIINAVDIFDKLAALQAANDYISTRNEIHGHAVELARAHNAGLQRVPGGPLHAWGVDPAFAVPKAPVTFASDRSLPSGQDYSIPHQRADLTSMAGAPTLGGLDLTQIDGLAGALATRVRFKQNFLAADASHSASGGDSSFANDGTMLKKKKKESNSAFASGHSTDQSQANTPTLSETENGRAVIKMVHDGQPRMTFEQK